MTKPKVAKYDIYNNPLIHKLISLFQIVIVLLDLKCLINIKLTIHVVLI